jgi:hypothetical protein
MIWSWIREQRPEAECLKAGWAGVMSLAIVPALGAEKTLRLGPAVEYRQLRGRKAAAKALPGDCFEMFATVERGRAFRLERGGAPLVEWRDGVLRSGKSQAEIRATRVTMQIFVDGSVIEVFANQSVVLAGRVYGTGGRVQATGHSFMECWEMAPVSPDRLTSV